eukprot:jgi/Mesvir1/8961/Mv19768-RA.1
MYVWREAELTHGRVAMLATVGFLVQERWCPLFGGKITGPAITHFQQVPTPFWQILTLGIAIAESYRLHRGWVDPAFSLYRLKGDYFPGDLGFDPLKLRPDDPDDFAVMQTKELNHGRLAMIGIAGMVAQELVTGTRLFPSPDEAMQYIQAAQDTAPFLPQASDALSQGRDMLGGAGGQQGKGLLEQGRELLGGAGEQARQALPDIPSVPNVPSMPNLVPPSGKEILERGRDFVTPAGQGAGPDVPSLEGLKDNLPSFELPSLDDLKDKLPSFEDLNPFQDRGGAGGPSTNPKSISTMPVVSSGDVGAFWDRMATAEDFENNFGTAPSAESLTEGIKEFFPSPDKFPGLRELQEKLPSPEDLSTMPVGNPEGGTFWDKLPKAEDLGINLQPPPSATDPIQKLPSPDAFPNLGDLGDFRDKFPSPGGDVSTTPVSSDCVGATSSGTGRSLWDVAVASGPGDTPPNIFSPEDEGIITGQNMPNLAPQDYIPDISPGNFDPELTPAEKVPELDFDIPRF